ncbi:Uncharacterised protein [Bordetella pertussis]|nr:Uncharacterised protein [Bordetella pertussis]
MISASEASVSQYALYSFWNSAAALPTEASGTPMPRASSAASASVRPAAGSTKTFRIFSGLCAATSSMSMPPSLEAMTHTRCVPRSVTMPT